MSDTGFQARRATLEDLPQLRKLWQSARLPVADLEKRFTEFQIATGANGQIAGVVGLHMERQHGHIHSEAFADPAQAEAIRPVLWDRIQRIARNNGLVRLWTPATISFYRQQGMVEIDEPSRGTLPPGFGSPYADWLTLKLKDENQPQLTIEQEFNLFTQSEKESRERVMGQARFFRVLAYGFLIVVFAAFALLAVFLFTRAPRKR